MDASDIRGMDDLDNLIEAARCLGLVQARKAFGQYGPDDAASEHGLHASISERSARLRAEVEALKAEDARLRKTWQKDNDELVQILGKALQYPRFADDQLVFPGATEADGVCVPCHTALSIADEAAEKIEALKAENAALASWQCLFTDGTTGLYHDGCGNAQCARDHLVVHLTAEVEALRADAERYRWLRNAAGRGAAGSIFDNFNGAAVDECIDAARAVQGGEHGR